MSTIESEYIATTKACKDAIWLTHLVKDLGNAIDMRKLHCDGWRAIMLATKTSIFHAQTKHIEVNYHFIREVLEDKLIKLVKVHNDDNLVDLLTMGLPLE